MAYNFEYPYTDPYRSNSDWLINTMKKLVKDFEEFSANNEIIFADPIQWNISTQYMKNTIVQNNGVTYLSKKPVPIGIAVTNTDYWLEIANFYIDIENLKKQIAVADDGASPVATEYRQVNSLIWLNSLLYKVIENINIGEAYIIDSNIKKVTIEDLLSNINNDILANTNDIIDIKHKTQFNNVVLIGDSFLQGFTNVGMVTPWGVFLEGYIKEINPNANVYMKAEGGAGFNTVGQSGNTFNGLINIVYGEVDANIIDHIIIIGGVNDELSGNQIAIQSTVNNIKNKFPNAQIIIGYNPTVTSLRVANNLELRVSYNDGETLILTDSQTWLYGLEKYNADDLHPTELGQEIISRCLWNVLNGKSAYYIDSEPKAYDTLGFNFIHDGSNISIYIRGTIPAGVGNYIITTDKPTLFKDVADIGIPVVCFDESVGQIVGSGLLYVASDKLVFYRPYNYTQAIFLNMRITLGDGALS